MRQYCFIGNHNFDDGITPEPMTKEEMMEFLSHSTGWIACKECWIKYEKRVVENSGNIEEDDIK